VAGSTYTPNRGDAELLTGEEDAGSVGIVAAVFAIDIGALDLDAGDVSTWAIWGRETQLPSMRSGSVGIYQNEKY
jgi:hypothetical protein